MLFKLRLLSLSATAGLLVACGGGSPTFVGPVYTITDGHVKGASAVCKVNPNSDSAVSPNFAATSLSDANGQFRFAQVCNAEVVASGGTNPDGLPLVGKLRAPANATVLTPLTTLMTGSSPMTEAQIITMLDLPAGTKLLSTDPASDAQLPLQAKSLAVQQVALQLTNTLVALGGGSSAVPVGSVYDAVTEAIAGALKSSASPLVTVSGTNSKFDQTVLGQLVTAAATKVALVDSNVQAGVAKVGAPNLAAATQAALAVQADALLAATATTLPTVTTNMQSNQGIPDVIATAVLGSSPTLTTATTNVDAVVNTVNSAAVTTTTTTTTQTGATTSTTTSSTAGPTSTTSTSSTVVTTSTTTMPVVPVNYLYLANDSISYLPYSGATATAYTLTDFKSAAGVMVNWPMADSAALQFTLAQKGNFTPPGAPITAAFAITDTAAGGQALIKGYIDQVIVSQGTNGVAVTVPNTATARIYAKDASGNEIMGSFSDTVSGVNNNLSYGSPSQITLGNVVRVAMNRLNGLSTLSGKYRVTLVLPGLMLAQADGTALTSYKVDVPVANGAVKSVTGLGIEGFMTLVNSSVPTTTVTTTTSSTTATTTTTTLPSPLNYLALANDSLSLFDGTSSTTYSLTQFQTSPGIAVKWPMASNAAIGLTLSDGGAFNVGSGQTYSAALEIADTAQGGLALVQAYIDKVTLTQNGAAVTVTVPTSAFARVYARAADGSEVISGFADKVAGVNTTLTTGVAGSIVLGDVVNTALTRLGNVTGLTGKTYRVTLVVPNSPLRLSAGSAFSSASVTVPGSLTTGTAAVTLTGPSLTGFINLTP